MLGRWRQRLPCAWALFLLPFLWLLMPAAPAPHRGSYKPVIVVHGLFDSSYSFRHLLDYINEVCQGTPGGWGRKRGQLKDNPTRPFLKSTATGVGRVAGPGFLVPASTVNARGTP